jgi:hypothetical protein
MHAQHVKQLAAAHASIKPAKPRLACFVVKQSELLTS